MTSQKQNAKYILPQDLENHFKTKHFSYISVYGVQEGELSNFVVWLPKPRSKVRQRATEFIRKLYGETLDFRVYLRTYIHDARQTAWLGMHEFAPLAAAKLAMDDYKSLWLSEQARRKKQRVILEEKLLAEKQNPTIELTGTFLGKINGSSLLAWCDNLGYSHIAPSWMHELEVGQKFIDGKPLEPEFKTRELKLTLANGFHQPIKTLEQKSSATDALIVENLDSNVFEIVALVILWQGEYLLGLQDEINVHPDPILQAIKVSDDHKIIELIGDCSASIFSSEVTTSSELRSLLTDWQIPINKLETICKWIKEQVSKHCSPSQKTTWPLSRLAVDSTIPLVSLNDRKVTLYAATLFGRQKIEATNIQIKREPYAQYTDAFTITFKPRHKRAYRQLRETTRPSLIVLLGWEHPSFQEIFKNTGANIHSTRFVSVDLRWEQEFDSALRFYLETNPLVRILLDIRGEIVSEERISLRNAYPRNNSNVPSELAASIPSMLFPVKDKSMKLAQSNRLFVSYHHTQDAEIRDEFEREFQHTFQSISIFPGEIGKRESDQMIRRNIRSRIAICDYIIVLVGFHTYSRKWVDYEIRTALDSTLFGGRRPIMAILRPELALDLSELIKQIDLLRPTNRTKSDFSTRVRRISDDYHQQILMERHYSLPLRLIDNLLSGYAFLTAWPDSESELQTNLRKTRELKGAVVNSRPLLQENLSLLESLPSGSAG